MNVHTASMTVRCIYILQTIALWERVTGESISCTDVTIGNMRIFTYRSRAGLYHVDFNHPDKIRTAKKSTELVKSITKTRRIPQKYVDYVKELNELEFHDYS